MDSDGEKAIFFLDLLIMTVLCVQDEALSLSLPRQRRRRRRKVEIEAERAAKRRNLMEMVAQLRESHATEGQTRAMDLTKTLHGLAPSSSTSSSSSLFPGSVASPMELLQAAGASRANGAMLESEIPTRRRRGRRKNVEGLELLFMGNKSSQLNTVKHACELIAVPLIFPQQSLIKPPCAESYADANLLPALMD